MQIYANMFTDERNPRYTVTESFALISDVGPTRATVEFLGTEEEVNAAGMHCEAYSAALIVPVRDGVAVEVGERVWIERAGERVLRISAGA